MDAPRTLLPGQRASASGRPRLDYLAVIRLAFPFMLNSAVQAVLNATDTWFVGRLSPAAISAMGAVYWPVLVFILLFGGIALSVQTLVAHAYGAGRYARASQATWTGLWGALLVMPLFAVLAVSGRALFSPFGLPPATLDLALAYWFPRMLGAPLGIALYAVLGFFNGIGRPTITLRVTLVVAVANAFLNQLFIFGFGLGVAGSAWATGAAQLCGLAMGFAWFFTPANRRRYRSHLTSRFAPLPLLRQTSLGFSMGLLGAADILGFALFQLMQVRLGNVDGASSQIVLMLTSFCYMPAVGVAMAGTTLVGQSIGAKAPDWARTAGNGIILLAVLYMGIVGVGLAAMGPWFLPWFTQMSDVQGAASRGAKARAAVDRRGIPALRWTQHLERRVSAGRGRCTLALAHGARPVVVAVRAARSCTLVQAGGRMGRLAAAIWAGRGRRLARRIDLHLLPGNACCSCAGIRAHGAGW